MLDGALALAGTGRPSREPLRPPLRLALRVEPSDPTAMRKLLELRRGDRILAWCRVRGPTKGGGSLADDPAVRLWSQGLDATASVKSARLVRKLEDGSVSLGRLLDGLRVRLLERLDRTVGSEGRARAILGAMLLGERSRLDSEDLRRLRDGGLLHLLAISGLHVSLAALFVAGILRRLVRSVSISAVCCSATIGAFVFLVGAAPPALRAGASAILCWAGRAIGREADPLNALALAAWGMVALEPGLLWNPGFELSVAATAGILAFSGGIASCLPFPKPMSQAAAVSIAAYLATAPLLAWRFERLAPVALLSNLVAGPLTALLLLTGGAVLLVGELPGIGPPLTEAARASAELLASIAAAAEASPFGCFRVARPSSLLLGAVLVLLLAAPRISSKTPRWRAAARIFRLALALLFCLLHLGPLPPGPSAGIEAAVLDVGQGLAVAVRAEAGRCLLVDAGGTNRGRFDAGERIVVPQLLRLGCRRLEALILTHDHDDHAGGAVSVLREMEVGELWVGAGSCRDPLTRKAAARAIESATAVLLAEAGRSARRAGVLLEFLHPDRADRLLPVNDRCVVVRISWPGIELLVPGDLEREGEQRLLAREARLASKVLVVGHHGAAGSSSEEWIRAIAPRIAIISAGRGNRFGHPHLPVLERLRRAGSDVYRTDLDGTIRLRLEADRIVVDSDLTRKRWEGE